MRIVHIRPRGSYAKAGSQVVLDHEARHRRRYLITAEDGTQGLLDEPRAVRLRDGDGLELEDGRIIAVKAAPEALMEVKARDGLHLLQLAWHCGNRHLACEIRADGLRLRHDRVIARMLTELGAQVVPVTAAFDPEGGAYDHSH